MKQVARRAKIPSHAGEYFFRLKWNLLKVGDVLHKRNDRKFIQFIQAQNTSGDVCVDLEDCEAVQGRCQEVRIVRKKRTVRRFIDPALGELVEKHGGRHISIRGDDRRL